MGEVSRLVDELSRAVEGDPWHGDSIARILDGVSAATAATTAGPHTHSIWQIVRHMTAWTNEVGRRLAGHPAGEPPDGDWPRRPGGATTTGGATSRRCSKRTAG